MSKLTKVYNGMYTIEQLLDAAKKLGVAAPTNDAEFQALADDIQNKREYQVILDVENGFEAEETPVERSETERVIHAFMADLVGTRKSLQAQSKTEIIRSFCELVFNKAIDRLATNPFALNTCVFIHEKDFKNYSQIYAMIVAEGSYTLSSKLTKLTADLGVKRIKIDISCNILSVIIDYE